MPIAFLYPRAVSVDSSSFVANGAATKWECIDDPEGLPDDDTTYIAGTSTIAGVEQISFAFDEMPECISIISVTVRLRSRFASGGATHQVFIASTGGAAHTLTGSYQDFSDAYSTNPDTGAPWSRTQVNAIAGVLQQSATVCVSRTTQFYLEVSFVASAAKIGAARDIGSRLLRLGRIPIHLVTFTGPLLWADVELGSDVAITYFAHPGPTEGEGAGMPAWTRALIRVIASEINLERLTCTITGFDLRHYLCRFWDTGIAEEPPGTVSGAARLDPGVGRTFTRPSLAWIQNPAASAQGLRQLVEVGADVEKAEPLGLLFEPERTNHILYSAYGSGVSTGWTVTGGVTDDNENVLYDTDVTAQAAAFIRSGSANCRLTQGSIAFAGGEILTFSLWHSDETGDALKVSFQRSTDSQYWVTGSTWNAALTQHTIPVREFYGQDVLGPITLGAGAQNLTVVIYAESAADQVNRVGSVQLEEGRYATSHIVTTNATVTRAADVLAIDALNVDNEPTVVWWRPQGTARFALVPEWSSSDTDQDDFVFYDVYLGGESPSWDRVLYRPADGQWRFERKIGGATYAATFTGAVTRGNTYGVVARWTGETGELGLEPFTLSIFVDGVKGTDVVASGQAPAGEFLYIGSETGVDHWAGGNMSFMQVTPFVMTDEEIIDWA